MANLSFYKYEGLGNDFVLVGAPHMAQLPLSTEQSQALCDRHLGIGADGVIFFGQNANGHWMRVINADGSESEMCGNGLRCLALHLANTLKINDFMVNTLAGPHRCVIDQNHQIQVEMRIPSLKPEDIHLHGALPLVDAPLKVGQRQLHITAVSMGNPHAVCFDDLSDADIDLLGPLLTAHTAFKQGVNAGFAKLLEPHRMVLRVHERGSGWTQACGTGACAAVVAAVHTNRVPRNSPITVMLPGGELIITVQESNAPVLMRGPARFVFEGQVPLSSS